MIPFARLAAAPMDVEGVHELRVLTRRLRSALLLQDSPDRRELKRRLRRLGRALGERRTLDVAAADLATLGGAPLPSLERRRAAAGVKLARRLLKAGRIAELLGGLLPRPPRKGLLERRARRLEKALAVDSEAAAHRLRIEAKKVRYLLEALGRGAAAARLKPLQRELGRAHDWQVLRDLLPEGDPRRARAEELGRARMEAAGKLMAGSVKAAAAALRRNA